MTRPLLTRPSVSRPSVSQPSVSRPSVSRPSVSRLAALALSLVCFLWVLVPLARNHQELRQGLMGGALVQAILAGVLFYALLSVPLALAWWWLSGIYGQRPSSRSGYVIFARSQLAKYLPGNAFHYVSRQLLGREAGLSHQALVASGLLELGSLVLAALLIAAVGVGSSLSGMGIPAWPWAVVLGVFSLLAWPALDLVLRRLPWTRRFMEGLPHLSPLAAVQLLGPALCLHTIFFLGAGLLLMVLAQSSLATVETIEVWQWYRIFPVAWIAGTVTVGAPAGVGVREAVLTVQLEPLMGPAPAAAIALALRLVTTGGDLLTAALGWTLGRFGQS